MRWPYKQISGRSFKRGAASSTKVAIAKFPNSYQIQMTNECKQIPGFLAISTRSSCAHYRKLPSVPCLANPSSAPQFLLHLPLDILQGRLQLRRKPEQLLFLAARDVQVLDRLANILNALKARMPLPHSKSRNLEYSVALEHFCCGGPVGGMVNVTRRVVVVGWADARVLAMAMEES